MPSLRPCVNCGEHIVVRDRFCPRCGAEQPSTATDALVGPQDSRWDDIKRRLQEATEGRYEIRGLIGRGGMAAVFLADWPHMDLRIAIKVMDPFLLDQKTAVLRFLQEARTIAKLKHRHIIRVYDSGHEGDLYYFCMDYYPGRSMENVLRAHEQLPVEVAKVWLWQAADALGYAHRQAKPVVHRDIKPSNILLDTDGDLVLTDFGIAKVRDVESTSPQPSLTMPGAVLGTPAYLSPEQASGILHPQRTLAGSLVTSASDQYSLGVVAYETLAGEPPFTGDLHALLSAHATIPPVHLLEKRPDCPPELADVVMRMLAKHPQRRWPEMEEICRAIGSSTPGPGSPLRIELSGLVRGTREVGIVSLSPIPDPVFEGQDLRLDATPLDLTGQPVKGRSLSWKSSDPAIALVSQDGMVKLLRPGTVCISATAEGVTGEIHLSVEGTIVDTVVVLPSQVTVAPGEAAAFRTLLLSTEGKDLEGRKVVWSSSDPGVATVTPEGWALARHPGRLTITATCEGRNGSATMTVAAPAVATIEISPSQSSIQVGDSITLECLLRDIHEDLLEGRAIQWESTHPEVAKVSDAGRVEGFAPGTTSVRAECDGVSGEVSVSVIPEKVPKLVVTPEMPVVAPGKTASVQALVKPLPVESLEILPSMLSLTEGASDRFLAVARSPEGEELSGRTIEWSSDDRSVATVSSNGMVEAAGAGTVQISASCEGRSATAEVSVVPAPADEVLPEADRVSVEIEGPTIRTLSPGAEAGPIHRAMEEASILTPGVEAEPGELAEGSVEPIEEEATPSEPGAPARVEPAPADQSGWKARAPTGVWISGGAVVVVALALWGIFWGPGFSFQETSQPTPVPQEVSPTSEPGPAGLAFSPGDTVPSRAGDSVVTEGPAAAEEREMSPDLEVRPTANRPGVAQPPPIRPTTPPPAEEEDEPAVARIRITPGTGDLIEGQSLQLRLTDQDGSPVSGSFRSSDPNVISVSPEGVLTAGGAGEVTVTGLFQGLSAEARFRVRPAVVDPPQAPLDSIRTGLTEVEEAASLADYPRAYQILDAIAARLGEIQEEFPRSSFLPPLTAEYLESFGTLYEGCQRFRAVMEQRGVQDLPTCRPPPTGGGNETPVDQSDFDRSSLLDTAPRSGPDRRPGRSALHT